MALRVSFTVLALATLAYAVEATGVFGTGPDDFFDTWISNGVLIGAAVLCLVRGATAQRDRAVWLVLGVSLTLWAGGDIVWSLFFEDDAAPPYPSIADALWLSFYGGAFVALA